MFEFYNTKYLFFFQILETKLMKKAFFHKKNVGKTSFRII